MDVALGRLSPTAKILRMPEVLHESKTAVKILSSNSLAYQVAVHASCICNERVALYNRHAIDRGYLPFDAGLFRRAFRSVKLPYEQLTRIHMLEIVKSYAGPRRKSYYAAYQRLQHCWWSDRYARVSMFIKPDKYSRGDVMAKAPRAIQFRSKEFNLHLASFLKPVEDYVYSEVKIDGLRCIVKGLSPFERAGLFMLKFKKFRDPVFLELDHSKFDSTVRVEHLKEVHRYYRRFYGRGNMLERLLRCQLRNVGWSKGGIKYRVDGTRMSGDYDTGLGNSILNYVVLVAWARMCNLGHIDVILDGDDSIMIVERKVVDKVVPALFARLGFETKFRVVTDVHQVDFCQCRFMTVPVPNFVRNPVRVASHMSVSLKTYNLRKYKELCMAMGLCELSLNPGIPIISVMARKYASLGVRPYFTEELRRRMGGIKWKMRAHPITDEARYQFYRCWGIGPAMQEALEVEFTVPSIFERVTQRTAEINYVATTGAVLWTAQSYETMGTSRDECWSAIGGGGL